MSYKKCKGADINAFISHLRQPQKVTPQANAFGVGFQKSGIIKMHLGLPNLRTIFVTTTERHIDNILKDAAKHFVAQRYPPKAILFVPKEKLEKFDPLSVEYRNAAGKVFTITEWQ